MTEYAQLLKDLFVQRNAGRLARLAEMAVTGELPTRRMESAKTRRGEGGFGQSDPRRTELILGEQPADWLPFRRTAS